jgi:chaperonin GroEL
VRWRRKTSTSPKPVTITTGSAARQRLVQGAAELSRVVKVTYGPTGGTVMLDRAFGLLSTRDGVTVACEVSPEDPVARLGSNILRRACVQVNEEAGDGTSTVALLAGTLLAEGNKLIAAGGDPGEIARGIRHAAYTAAEVVGELAVPVEDQDTLRQIALHTTKRDEPIADALAEACMVVGSKGMIVIEDGKGVGIEVVPKHGVEVPSGWDSLEFGNDEGEWRRDVCLVAVVATPLMAFADVAPIMEAASTVAGNLPLLIVGEGVYGEALATMVTNNNKDVLPCCAIKGPGRGPHVKDHLQDIAALTQATLVDPDAGLSHQRFQSEWLGSIQQAHVGPSKTTLIAFDDALPSIQDRIRSLERRRDATIHSHDRDRLSERIAKLADGFCVLRVGGVTEAAAKERRGRIEDALHAVRAALDEGVVPGAGMAYLSAAQVIEDIGILPGDMGRGQSILASALREPVRALATNAGHEASVVLARLRLASDGSYWHGWDALEGRVRDLLEPPILADPLRVVRSTIEVAASVAATLLTAEVAITSKGTTP